MASCDKVYRTAATSIFIENNEGSCSTLDTTERKGRANEEILLPEQPRRRFGRRSKQHLVKITPRRMGLLRRNPPMEIGVPLYISREKVDGADLTFHFILQLLPSAINQSYIQLRAAMPENHAL